MHGRCYTEGEYDIDKHASIMRQRCKLFSRRMAFCSQVGAGPSPLCRTPGTSWRSIQDLTVPFQASQ